MHTGGDSVSTSTFFDETTEQSRVKAAIVSKYFWAWAKVILPTAKKKTGKIAYIDLFAGPGRYKDGTVSTPLLVLQRAISDPDLRQMLVTIFNDRDTNHARSLEKEIAALPEVASLKYYPQVHNEEVGERIVKIFEQMRLVPTLFFVDPWGYRGLSLRLINAVLKDWGCDCIFFFNYNRINPGLSNPAVREHMDALFGEHRAAALREGLLPPEPRERELAIVEEICEALQELGGKYVLPFCFKNQAGSRTSHHLIFVSKHFKGYEIMKEIMARESSRAEQGVASLEYCPANTRQPMLFELARPLDELEGMLLEHFAGQTRTLRQIYEEHNVGRPYVWRNYREALIDLENAGRVSTQPCACRRRKGAFPGDVKVTFPPKAM